MIMVKIVILIRSIVILSYYRIFQHVSTGWRGLRPQAQEGDPDASHGRAVGEGGRTPGHLHAFAVPGPTKYVKQWLVGLFLRFMTSNLYAFLVQVWVIYS